MARTKFSHREIVGSIAKSSDDDDLQGAARGRRWLRALVTNIQLFPMTVNNQEDALTRSDNQLVTILYQSGPDELRNILKCSRSRGLPDDLIGSRGIHKGRCGGWSLNLDPCIGRYTDYIVRACWIRGMRTGGVQLDVIFEDEVCKQNSTDLIEHSL